jgi:hypothetical protein
MLVLLNKYYFIKSMVEDRFDSNLETIVLLEAADDGGGNLKVTCKLHYTQARAHGHTLRQQLSLFHARQWSTTTGLCM